MSPFEAAFIPALAEAGAGTWHWDRTTGEVVWDEGLERLFGLRSGAFEGTFEAWSELIHPNDREHVLQAVEAAVENRAPLKFDHRCVWPDGSVHWIESRGGILVDDKGEVVGAAGVALDVDSRRLTQEERNRLFESERAARTSLEESWQRLAQLQLLAVHLAGAVGVREVGRVMVEQGAQALKADGGFFSVVDREQHLLVLQATKGAAQPVTDFYERLPIQADNPASEVARTGQTIYIESHEDREARFPDLPDQGAAAFVIHPVRVRGEIEAVVAYGFVEAHEFTFDEKELVSTMAGMSTQALQRARLHDATERAARLAEQLESVTGRLAGATSRKAVADIVVDSLIPAVGAQAGSLFLVDDEGKALRSLVVHGYPEGAEDALRELPLDAAAPPIDAFNTRAPVFIESPDEYRERYPGLASSIVGQGIAAVVHLPLIVDLQPIGSMGLAYGKRHPFDLDERRHLAIVAGICAQAVGRALAFEAAEQAHTRLASLDQISGAALSRLSLAELLATLPERIAAAIECDAVRIFLTDESGTQLEVRGQFGATEEELARVPIGRGLAGTIAATAEPRLIEDISRHEVVRPAFPPHVVSEAGVPLLSEGKVIGVLDVGSGPSRPLTEDDIELLEIAADRIAAAIDRSRAYELERRARLRSESLVRLGEIINQAGSLEEMTEAIAEHTVRTLSHGCLLTVLSESGKPFMACAHRDPHVIPVMERLASAHPYDPTARKAALTLARAGDVDQVVDDPLVSAMMVEVSAVSVMSVTLLGLGGPVGVIHLLWDMSEDEAPVSQDRELAEDLAIRIGAAVDSRLLFEQHRNTAITLQRSLLPSRLPEIDGLEIAARYWPASERFEVGGDFYDVIDLGEGRWGITVGDVSGKGVAAAAMTGIARHTARAAARHGVDPSGVLKWVHDAFLTQAETSGAFCTAVFGILEAEPDGFSFRFSVGGHPLPIFRPDGGGCRSIGRPGTVLGLVDDVDFTESQVSLRPGDWLVVYTDGVTDVPTADAITEEELLEIVERSTRRSAPEAVTLLDDVLRTRYQRAHNRDDTAVLLIRCLPSPSEADTEP
ncbi:MAG TPA: GAF domain-containing protein [Acidimicrobiia bacterium]|nr:GAF domain-containing protein [Acidimicrobiia bacterium]